MDASQWSQQHHQVAGLARTMEEIQPLNNIIMNNHHNNNNMGTISTNLSSSSRGSHPMVDQRKIIKPQNKEQNLNCPRCNSTNTKFCYYNNYSLTQPRYFCKTCRRYWTQGGSLRNVPVGGGSRKNKRSLSSSSPSILASSSSSIPSKMIPDLNPPNTLPHLITAQNPNNKLFHLDIAHDLNLAFPMQGGNIFHHHPNSNISNSTPTTTTTSTATAAVEFLRSTGGIVSRGNLSSYIPMPMSMPDPNSPLYPSGFPNLQEFKPSLGVFPSSHGGNHGNNENNNHGARLLFPFADMNKLASSAKSAHHNPDHHDHDQISKGDDHHDHDYNQGKNGYYWSGMLGGGTWYKEDDN